MKIQTTLRLIRQLPSLTWCRNFRSVTIAVHSNLICTIVNMFIDAGLSKTIGHLIKRTLALVIITGGFRKSLTAKNNITLKHCRMLKSFFISFSPY